MTATNDLISHNDGERQATTTTWEEFGSTKTASDKRQRRRRRFLFKKTPTYQRQVCASTYRRHKILILRERLLIGANFGFDFIAENAYLSAFVLWWMR
jgi:hypothetical protein